MAEMSPKERLQPSLIDRLRDEERDKNKESRDKRVLSVNQLKDCIIRDLSWLLNTGQLEMIRDLDDLPYVKKSVLNYGVPNLTGFNVNDVDFALLERELKTAIIEFEPRILRKSLKVSIVVDDEVMGRNTMVFKIEGDLWAQPVPLALYLKTEVDLETGNVNVIEGSD